ncbi:MAG TPA: hypothetical protein VN039_09890 [Nitrospira sp.]|nr:hypothetical protein [Nitrospira sp.]
MTAKVLTNLESIGDLVGALSGIDSALDDQMYMEGLIKSAHGRAATAFDLAAAATAKTGRMSHVYEYGTIGVTRGMPKFADPASPKARLYVHTLVGQGGEQSIGYTFRPARQPNPKPTPESTGVDSKYLSRLSGRQYYFYNKAYVMETGRVVEIKPRNGNFLFVPFYGEASRDPLNNRGYMMWDSRRLGPLSARPGRSTKGEFTQFWMQWWATSGSKMMYAHMEEQVNIDVGIAMAEAQKRAQTEAMKPVQDTNIVGAISTAKALFNKIFKASTSKRMGTKTL